MGASPQQGNLAKTGTAPTGKPPTGSLDAVGLDGSSASAASGLNELAMPEGIGQAFKGKYLSPEALQRLLISATGTQPDAETEPTRHPAEFVIVYLSTKLGIPLHEAKRLVSDELAHGTSHQAHLPQLEDAKKDLRLRQDVTGLEAGREREIRNALAVPTGTMRQMIEDYVNTGIGDRLTSGKEILTVNIPKWVEVSLASSPLMRSITTAAAWVAYRAKQAFHLATSVAGLVVITRVGLAVLESVTGSRLSLLVGDLRMTFGAILTVGAIFRVIYCFVANEPLWGRKWQRVNRPEPNLLTKGEVDLSKGSKNSSAVTKLLEFCKEAGITVHQSVDHDGTRTWSFHA
jgi:hypothetical protein